MVTVDATRTRTSVEAQRRGLIPAARLVAIALAGVAAAVSAASVADDDFAADLAAAMGQTLAAAAHLTRLLNWPVVALLSVVSVVHYLAAATAARAAAGVRLPHRELFAAQFAASAANRLTPAGLGGAGVLGRFLSRRGGLSAAQSTAAVSSLAALGALSDVAAFAVLLAGAATFGVSGAAAEVPHLLAQLAALMPFTSNPIVGSCAGVLVIAAATTLLVFRRARPTGWSARAASALGSFASAVATLVRHPARVTSLALASAATTVALAGGFAAAAVMGPTHLAVTEVVPLMIGYMVAAAAGNAIPTPGGIGATDAAFVGVLIAAHASAGPALAVVITFRVVTFWLPALIGLATARHLRRTGAL